MGCSNSNTKDISKGNVSSFSEERQNITNKTGVKVEGNYFKDKI